MKNWFIALGALGLLSAAPLVQASPQQDYQQLKKLYQERFPGVTFKDYGYGAYALDKGLMAQFQAAMEFNPGDMALDEGKQLWDKPFANGKTYASCYPNGGKGVATGYPRYDEKLKTVVTLPMTLNMCREANGEKPLPYGKPEIVALETYLKSLSNGMPINVKVSGKEALAKYEAGKAYYNARRGQLNFSCATCHVQNAGKMIRADLLSPMMGQANHFPTYRGAWNRVGTMQDRYRGCNSQVRAKPEDFESENYRNLEYYHTYMSNGIPIEVPGYRK
ncbi:sulfur oxidation c-type cytochrome SoxA [Thermithiobacillus tepidarius DSM 3134]|uniref:sulfur oxidation c-type cytochrome SoxA n=1 Tax=Thermithiobacillus tepidarius TaxID=929 RepID=UPI00040C5161|nr:sulfur oxidation c-type cytochrome SoxA [Thermithiobacillus tepidarius]